MSDGSDACREVHVIFTVDPAGDRFDWETLVDLGALAASQVDVEPNILTFDRVEVVALPCQ